MSSRKSSRVVRSTSLREASGSSSGRIPAAARSGSVSSKMRPLDRASVITGDVVSEKRGFYRQSAKTASKNKGLDSWLVRAPDPSPEPGELLLDALVAAVEMV